MADDQDDSQKTEDPTQKRLTDAFNKGQVPSSREVASFMILLALAMTLLWLLPGMMQKTAENLLIYIESPHLFSLDPGNMTNISEDMVFDFFSVMSVPIIITVLFILFSSIVQHPPLFSMSSAAPKLERISLFKGLGRLFSMRTIVEFIKGLTKIILVGSITYAVLWPEIDSLAVIPTMTVAAIWVFLAKLAGKVMIGVCSMMLLIGVADFLYQKFEHIKGLRMSFQDIKDEYKQTEGNPEVKAKLREIRQQRASQRMMADVPKADVIVTNPTHYSIALKYDDKMTEAPVIIAKGKDLIALKIREVAKENKIPLYANPPLARALFASVDIGDEIPVEHYNAVAEVIKYVYKLKGRK